MEKVLDSVSEKFGIARRFGFGFVQIWGILGDVSVSKFLAFETYLDGFGYGIKKVWYQRKYRILYISIYIYYKSTPTRHGISGRISEFAPPNGRN